MSAVHVHAATHGTVPVTLERSAEVHCFLCRSLESTIVVQIIYNEAVVPQPLCGDQLECPIEVFMVSLRCAGLAVGQLAYLQLQACLASIVGSTIHMCACALLSGS